MSTTLVARTPAKLNLGLEVLGRRADGYHDIMTVMQAIDIYDEIHFTPDANRFEYVSDPAIDPKADIARPIVEARAVALGWTGRLALRKRIPTAAGLGGGSSDAALALRIAFAGEPTERLERRAAAIGADVPFLIRGGAALASGIGTELTEIPLRSIWFVIVIPDVTFANKTGSMYAALSSQDFSSGDAVIRIARMLGEGKQLPNELPNAFERHMRAHEPVEAAWELLETVAGRVALSGAGPAIYSWFSDQKAATTAAEQLRIQSTVPVILAKSVTEHIRPDETAPIAHALRGRTQPLSERGG